jgi:hypothetical protein
MTTLHVTTQTQASSKEGGGADDNSGAVHMVVHVESSDDQQIKLLILPPLIIASALPCTIAYRAWRDAPSAHSGHDTVSNTTTLLVVIALSCCRSSVSCAVPACLIRKTGVHSVRQVQLY